MNEYLPDTLYHRSKQMQEHQSISSYASGPAHWRLLYSKQIRSFWFLIRSLPLRRFPSKTYWSVYKHRCGRCEYCSQIRKCRNDP